MAGRGKHAVREVRKVANAETPTHRHLRERLILIAVATIGVDLFGTAIEYLLERNAHGTQIRTVGDALFWTTTQLLTVSSQLPNPISTGGRIVDVFLQVWAISVIATLAGSFGAFFHRRGLERDPLVSDAASAMRARARG